MIQALCNGVGASAQTVSLTNGNSSVSIDLSSPAGMSDWLVDGVNFINQQSFLSRTDSRVAAPISSLGAPSISVQIPNALVAIYTGPQFTITTVFALTGGSPGRGPAVVGEQIKIQNTSQTPLNLAFFQFTDFAGNGTAEVGQNAHGVFNQAFIPEGAPGPDEIVFGDTLPGANEGMVGDAAAVMNDLLTVPSFTLAGPEIGTGASALEWDRTLDTNQAVILSGDLDVEELIAIPEPSAMRIGVAGLVLGGLIRIHTGRRQKAGSGRI